MSTGTVKLKSSRASDQIQTWIRNGRFTPGERLPSERAMAEELQLNHLTIRRGLAALVSRGVIEKRPNVGNFVSEATPAVEMAIVLPRFVLQGDRPHPIYTQLLSGIQGGVDQRTSATTVLSYRPGKLWEDVGDLLVSRKIRGVILAPGSDVRLAHVEPLLRAGIEIVLVKPTIELLPLGLTSVVLDMSGALAQLLDGVLARGHRNIVVAQNAEYTLHGFDRQIIESVLRRYGIDDFKSVILEIPSSSETIDTSVLESIFLRPIRPTAVVLQDEYHASALFRMCYERHVRVPDELSVGAVFDSTPHLHPVQLTAANSMSVSREHGRVAAAMLSKQLAGGKPLEREIRIRCDIQWRASVATLDSHNNHADRTLLPQS